MNRIFASRLSPPNIKFIKKITIKAKYSVCVDEEKKMIT